MRELYELTWPGKHEAVIEAGRVTDKTLRPDIELSKNFESTQNLYIEGDNLEALKLLQKSYMKRVKLIYIDPPYNTGHDFIYRDEFSQSELESQESFNLFDDEGSRNFTLNNYRENSRANPRFHSDWLSMIYPRLKLARNLLRDDGVIFISIDDNEQANLRKICDEIFGESNFTAQFTWRRRSGANDAVNNVSIDHEYVLCYSGSKGAMLRGVAKTFENYSNPDNDPRGAWTRGDLTCGKTASQRPNLFYPITDPATGIIYECSPAHVWRFERVKMQELINTGKVIFPPDGKGTPAYKRHKNEVRSETKPYSSIIDTDLNSSATRDLREILGGQYFDYSKPLDLLKQLIFQGTDKDSIILDFFAGSSTTAHAVMSLNAQDGGSRKFIMIQIPEQCSESGEAFKAGYKTICDIGRERIVRSGKLLVSNQKTLPTIHSTLDTGFRVLKVDSGNYRDVYFTPEELSQDMLDDLIENIKPDRTGPDLLFGTVIELGLSLSLKYSCEHVNDFLIHYYGNNNIIACFDGNINASLVEYIARKQPSCALFRDSCFEDSNTLINLEQIFTHYAPDSELRIL